jgi:pimeloyl-ACP methyl ester carboxylesterase
MGEGVSECNEVRRQCNARLGAGTPGLVHRAGSLVLMRRSVVVPAISAVMVGAALAAAPGVVRRRMMPPERPVSRRPGDYGMAGRSVWLDGPRDRRLHGWYIPVAGVAPAVVVLHGWGANASDMLPLADRLHHAGFHALFLDARGHGLSEHDDYASMPRFSEDLEVAIGWLSGLGAVSTIGVIGHSVGAGAAILAAARNTGIDAIVAVSGFADVWEIMRDGTSIGRLPAPGPWAIRWAMERVLGRPLDEIAPERVAASLQCPVLIIHGEADEIIPVTHGRRLAEAAGADLIVIPGAGHASLEAFEPYFGAVLAFLIEALDRR